MRDDVLTFVEGRVGRIRLNRPKAINALNTAMCVEMLDTLAAWEHDSAIEAVLVDHTEGRGFCAGGDIRMIAESAAGDGSKARQFFHTEYRLNHRLFIYAKPVVAFMNGITMGGGVGISQPAKFRVATANTCFAMPETGIGLFPDVGGGWYLSRLPGRIGQYLALTGTRIDGAECLALGLATHHLPTAAIEEAKARIAGSPRAIQTILADLSVPTPEPALLACRNQIDRLFAADKLEDIYAALEADGDPWAAMTLETLRTKSPQAMKVSLKLLREGASVASFEEEMRKEYAISCHVVQRHDFIEGVRALIIDKDNAPRWSAAAPEEMSDQIIDQIFAALPQEEAWAVT